jgi:hypothetical protein
MLQHARTALARTVKPVVKSLDWVLRSNERDGRLSLASQLLLIGFNAIIFACLFYHLDRPWVRYAIFATLLLQAAIIGAALLIIAEETRYWDGLILGDEKILPAISCVRTAGLLTIASIALVFLAGLLCQHLDQFGTPLIKSRTSFACESTACQYFEYVLICLHQMPVIGGLQNKGWGLRQARLLLEESHASLDQKLRTGVISAVCHQIKTGDHRPAIVADLWNIAFLVIGDLAGGELAAAKAKMLTVAVEPISAPNNYTAGQKRLLDLCSGAQIKAFPKSFLFSIEDHSDEVKLYGLELVHRQIAQSTAIEAETLQKSLTYALRDPKNSAVKEELQALRQLIRAKGEIAA